MTKTIFAAHHKNDGVLSQSSSGGIFTACSDVIFQRGGSVVAAKYDYDTHTLAHSVAVTQSQRDAMRGSKYVQSRISAEIYRYIEQQLKENQYVLFVGTPCQVSALQRYLQRKKTDTTTLITIDLLCHGVGSPGIWKSYMKLLSRNGKREISFVTFRDKRRGWHKPTCVAADGHREYSLRGFSWLYYADSIMRPSCHSCAFASFDRPGDLSIGDFWGKASAVPDGWNSRGTSLVMVNSAKGAELMERIQSDIRAQESTKEACTQPNLQRPTPCGKHREAVMRDYEKKRPIFFFTKWSIILLAEKLWKRIRK